MLDKNNKRDLLLNNTYGDNLFQLASFTRNTENEHNIPFKQKLSSVGDYKYITPGSFKTFFWNNVVNYPESFWYTVVRLSNQRRKKIYVTKCSDRTSVTAG